MRIEIIITIVAAVVILAGGVIWYNSQSDVAELEQQRTEQVAQTDREQVNREQADRNADLAREEEAATAERAARETEAAEAQSAEEEATAERQTATDDDLIVLGDAITEGATVVESATGEAVILDADNVATSAEIIDDNNLATASVRRSDDAERSVGNADTMGVSQDVTGPATEIAATEFATNEFAATEFAATDPTTTPTTDPARLLTPENFDRDEVLALIDESGQLTPQQRSALRALVGGTDANPAMIEPAIRSIRTMLDLPPLT